MTMECGSIIIAKTGNPIPQTLFTMSSRLSIKFVKLIVVVECAYEGSISIAGCWSLIHSFDIAMRLQLIDVRWESTRRKKLA